VRQPPNHGVTRDPLTATASAPSIRFDDPARKDRSVRLEPLPGGFKAELVEPAERGQINAGEARIGSSVRHVEVFQMGGVRTSILGRPRRLPSDRRADSLLHPRLGRASKRGALLLRSLTGCTLVNA